MHKKWETAIKELDGIRDKTLFKLLIWKVCSLALYFLMRILGRTYRVEVRLHQCITRTTFFTDFFFYIGT